MDFALLGPLEIRDGGRPVALGRGKPVALLIALLLDGDRVVSSDRLVDALWGERPPATATKALHVHIRTLRRALGPDRIVTRPRGYSVRVGPDEVDIGRFEALAERGRSALTGGDSASAARLLREALGLWRGPALADVADEPFARAEAARLEDLRLAVLEDRLDADLALGRHVEIASELDRLVSEHPLRERLHGHLMLALYRSGRQADALAAYRRARKVLVEELGLEPGPALQAVERQILAHDPALEAPAAAVSAPAGPELKLATIVVAELAPAHAGGDPELLTARLERGRRAATEALRAAGGRVELGIGGTLLAAFGVPAAQEDHVERALEAALTARAAVKAECGNDVAVRIGVESGEVVAGEGAVSGPPVGAAAALAGNAASGGVAVGGRARTRSRGAFTFEDDRLLGAVGVGARRGTHGRATAFVGRGDELALLEATWDRVARSSQPHLATIVGDAGIGKTSLLVTLRQRLGPGVRWYVGRCLAHGQGMSYGALAEIVRERLGLYRADEPDALVQRLGSRRALAPLIGLEAEPGVHPWEARERLRAAWVELLEEVAAEGPAVAWVEDLHWADEALLELLEHGLRETTGPLLLLATARPELLARRPGWGAGSAEASRLRLEPLGAEDAAMMLDRLEPGLPAGVADRVLDRAEGNPFFVEEVLAALLERGALRRGSAGWVVDGVADALAVSDSVQGVIAARIDMLPAGTKRALQTASVVGRSFWEGAVRDLAGTEPGGLAELCERDFVRRSRGSAVPGEREFAFKHALTREVAYASIPVASRARLHAGFAAWLERTGGGRDEDAPLLAHHYAESVAPANADLAWRDEPDEARRTAANAVRWLRRAAELAASRYAIAEAVTMLGTAVKLESDPARRAELWYATATAHRANYDVDAFRGAIEHAVALAPDAPVAARAYADLADAGSQRYLWRRPPDADLVTGWIDAALERAGADDVARAKALIGRAQLDLAKGRADADEALRLAERVGDLTLRSQAIDAQLHVAATQGRLDDAWAWARRGLEAVPGVPDRDQRSGTLLYAAFAHLWVGRIADARRIADEHDAVATPLSAHHHVHAVAVHLFVHMAAGDWPAPAGLAERVEAASAANADTPCQFNWRSLLMLALSHAIAGDADESRRLEQEAEAALTVGGPLPREPALLRLAMVRGDRCTVEAVLSADPGSDIWDVDYEAARLDALALLGDRAGVEAEAERAIELGGYVEPFALRALGAVRGRRELLADAAERFAAMGMERRAQETRAMA